MHSLLGVTSSRSDGGLVLSVKEGVVSDSSVPF
jgi:hypothetical protein